MHDVVTYGARGYGDDDLPAFTEAALNAAQSGSPLVIPPPVDHYFLDGTWELPDGLVVIGPGRTVDALVGNGVDPVVGTGVYPDGNTLDHRDIELHGLNIHNDGATAVEWLTAANFLMYRCGVTSSGAPAIKVRYSARGTIRDTHVAASGGSWAIDARDNGNGMLFDHCTLTGGALGGALLVGKSQVVMALGNIIETSKYGIQVAGADGRCLNPVIEGNYLENVEQPISIGSTFQVFGGSVSNNLVTNGAATFDPLFAIEAGRCDGVRMVGNVHTPKAAEPDIKFLYDAGSLGSTPYPEGCTIEAETHDVSDFPSSAWLGRMSGLNRLETPNGLTGPREWLSPTIDPSAGLASVVIGTDQTYGGWVDAVEIVEATGTLACTVDLGTSVSVTEVDTFDPSSLSYSGGVASRDVGVMWRAGEWLRCRVQSGAGTGSFRIRVRWRGAP